MNSVLNISAYRFVSIADPHALRETLLQRARAVGLKGTILLATEGINLFLAGAPDAVRGFVAALQLSIAAAGICLAVTLACWIGTLVLGHERWDAPRFFWPHAVSKSQKKCPSA